ncbi:MAG: HAD hydrolase family protein [Planctomycetales bacterium]|nr:HAD hydrolase family protein [Planctomycetales bacterium]
MKIETRCKQIELILSDVDGVLTDGGVIFDNQGIEIKQFHVRDGLGIKLWQRAGYAFGVVTARNSHIVKMRAAELGVDIVRQGFEQKLPTVKEILADRKLSFDAVCYIGDDLTDLPVLKSVGLAVGVADAVAEVRAAAHVVTKAPGGSGAVRETIETILKAKKRWDDLIQKYQ